MPMTRTKWSVNGLATELQRDRRTIAALLDKVEPAGTGQGGSPIFWMSDVVRVLSGGRPSASAFAERADAVARFLLSLIEGRLDPQTIGKALARTKDSRECVRLVLEMLVAEALETIVALESDDDDAPPVELAAGLSWEQLGEIVDRLDGGELADEIIQDLSMPQALTAAR